MLQRYEWEDSLIVAHRDGHLSNGALTVCLKLAKAINWAPQDPSRKEPGLYWKNDHAFKDVGLGRSTYYRYRAELLSAGVLAQVRGNLIPRLVESWPETTTSQVETEESTAKTAEPTGEQPFTVDTFPVDTSSEDEFPGDTAVADAPAVELEDEGSHFPLTSNTSEPAHPSSNRGPVDLGEFRQSTRGTFEEAEYASLMTDWYERHPEEAVTVWPPPGPATAVENGDEPKTTDTNVRPLNGPSMPSPRGPRSGLEVAG